MNADLREQVRSAYGDVAKTPSRPHPFRVGRELALRANYPEAWLAGSPEAAVDAFAGVSCLPCFVQVGAEDRVLDLGCGSGLDSLLVAPQVRSVTGVDFSEAMLDRARAAAQASGLTNVKFLLGDAERIPADAGAFNTVMVNGIFNLNPARATIFRELARVVRPGGTVFAAELVLKAPLPPHVRPSTDDWFA